MSSQYINRTQASLVLLITLGVIWGTGYSIARFAMTNGVSPLGYSFWQSLGPAIIMLSLLFFTEMSPKRTRSNYLYYLITGLTGIAIPNTCMYFSAQHLPASILAIVVNTVPIIAYPLALLAREESFNTKRLAGILIAFLGLMAITLPKSALPNPDLLPWVLFTLITPLSFAVCSVYIARNRPQHESSLSLTAGMLTTSTLILLPWVLKSNSFYWFHYPLTVPDLVILLEILLSSIGYVLLFTLIKLAGPVFYSLVDTVVVLTGIFWGQLLFGESLSIWVKLAVIFILSGVYLVTKYQYTQKGEIIE